MSSSPEHTVLQQLQDDADLDAVVALEARCFSNPWTRDMLARELGHSDVAHVFVLRARGGEIVAFCFCWIVPPELHINTIAVDDRHRRRGLASQLMRYVIREAAARGATRATLEVRESNAAARRLYESLGFAVTARRLRYYSEPDEDALILWKEGLAGGDGTEADSGPPGC